MAIQKTFDEYLIPLCWDVSKLAREANIGYHTARKAIDGEAVTARTARAIAAAISKGTGQQVMVGDIRGLVVLRTVGTIVPRGSPDDETIQTGK